VALNELVIKWNILDKIKCRACVAFTDLKRISVLSRFFSYSQVNEHLLFFSTAEIISKCTVGAPNLSVYRVRTVPYRIVPYPTVFREGSFWSTAQRTVLFWPFSVIFA